MQNMDDYKGSEVMAQAAYEITSGVHSAKERLVYLVKKTAPQAGIDLVSSWMLTIYDNEKFMNLFLQNGPTGFQWHIIDGELRFIGVFDFTFAINRTKLTKLMKAELKKRESQK